MGKYWDLDKLMDNADAFDVADHIGMKINRCGGAAYVECVSGTHRETRLNHNQLFHDGCHCYSCGASHNVYGMVRDYYRNVVGTPLDHDDICSLIAETCGGEDEYLVQNDMPSKKQAPFPLTKEELEMIGLSSSRTRARKIRSFQEYKDDVHRDLIGCEGYAETEMLPPMNIYTLYQENRELFYEIVRGKIIETMGRTRSSYLAVAAGTSEFEKAIAFQSEKSYRTAVDIYKRLFPGQKRAVS